MGLGRKRVVPVVRRCRHRQVFGPIEALSRLLALRTSADDDSMVGIRIRRCRACRGYFLSNSYKWWWRW